MHPLAPHHLPGFITAPGDTDALMIGVGIFLILAVVGVGNLYLHLHSLPERMAHKSKKLQFEIVAVLCLLSLFTHNHLYWVIGLFLAMVDLPDFITPLRRIAGSVDKLAGVPPEVEEADTRRRLKPPTATGAGHGAAPPRARCRVMLEIILCSLVTVLPDYLYRRYRQGKRIGHEITLFSVWYELRFGIITCLMLTVALITMIFYFHPSTTSATLYYRTVPIMSETIGRVAEVHVELQRARQEGRRDFQAGQLKAASGAADGQDARSPKSMPPCCRRRPIFSRRKVSFRKRRAALQQAPDELDVKRELQKRNPGIVPQRDIEKLEVAVAGRQGSLDAATASKQSAMIRVSALLPAEKASAEAALAEAQVDLDKTFIRAGVDGRVEQFVLRPGDIVNPMIRSAGVLIPGRGRAARPDGGVWADRRRRS